MHINRYSGATPLSEWANSDPQGRTELLAQDCVDSADFHSTSLRESRPPLTSKRGLLMNNSTRFDVTVARKYIGPGGIFGAGRVE